ncbi:MAG TPA: TIGR03617 family F420-dependent LLM class oxidoreductase [Dehalococcoidia bacterium]|nr:TIGR03617 family F420-dependent LLM class oxidoreductase [Dehalococcoidia bacterium]
MKVGTGVGGWLAQVPEAARRADELGYDFVSCGELSHDSILTMTVAAANSERVELQTSVTIAFPRSPLVLAYEAWDLQAFSKGRFVLGLGSQVKGHNERRFGMQWQPGPANRMREYIKFLKAAWDVFQNNSRPNFVGKYYQFTLMTPNFNPGPIQYPRPKVFLACVGDAMARTAGEVADGVLPHGFMTDKYMREVVLPNVKIGLERSGRDWSDIELSGGGFTVFGENESEIEQGLERLKQPISFYGSTRSYHEVFEVHGLKDFGMQLHALSISDKPNKWEEMRNLVTEDILRTFAQTSTYDKLPEFIRDHREYASRIGFSMPMRTPAERERFQHVMRQIQAIKTPGVPRGLEIRKEARAGA